MLDGIKIANIRIPPRAVRNTGQSVVDRRRIGGEEKEPSRNRFDQIYLKRPMWSFESARPTRSGWTMDPRPIAGLRRGAGGGDGGGREELGQSFPYHCSQCKIWAKSMPTQHTSHTDIWSRICIKRSCAHTASARAILCYSVPFCAIYSIVHLNATTHPTDHASNCSSFRAGPRRRKVEKVGPLYVCLT